MVKNHALVNLKKSISTLKNISITEYQPTLNATLGSKLIFILT